GVLRTGAHADVGVGRVVVVAHDVEVGGVEHEADLRGADAGLEVDGEVVVLVGGTLAQDAVAQGSAGDPRADLADHRVVGVHPGEAAPTVEVGRDVVTDAVRGGQLDMGETVGGGGGVRGGQVDRAG